MPIICTCHGYSSSGKMEFLISTTDMETQEWIESSCPHLAISSFWRSHEGVEQFEPVCLTEREIPGIPTSKREIFQGPVPEGTYNCEVYNVAGPFDMAPRPIKK